MPRGPLTSESAAAGGLTPKRFRSARCISAEAVPSWHADRPFFDYRCAPHLQARPRRAWPAACATLLRAAVRDGSSRRRFKGASSSESRPAAHC
jgi:hypothetical protein